MSWREPILPPALFSVHNGLLGQMDKATSVNTEAHTSRDNLMAKAKISTRVQISLIALAATYIVGDVSIGLWFWDLQISLLFLIWSIPFFAVGWLVTGVPVIAAGDLVLRIPIVLVAVMGAAAGVFVLLLMRLFELLRYLILTGKAQQYDLSVTTKRTQEPTFIL
jgi:hypothetical protein